MARKTPIELELEFAHFTIHQNHVVSTIKEGVSFDLTELEQISSIFKTHFLKEPFVSIANRKFDYTINPTCLMYSDIIPNLVGIGVVCYTDSAKQTAKFEKSFYKGNYEIFDTMKSALEWAEKRISSSKKMQAYKPDSVS